MSDSKEKSYKAEHDCYETAEHSSKREMFEVIIAFEET